MELRETLIQNLTQDGWEPINIAGISYENLDVFARIDEGVFCLYVLASKDDAHSFQELEIPGGSIDMFVDANASVVVKNEESKEVKMHVEPHSASLQGFLQIVISESDVITAIAFWKPTS